MDILQFDFRASILGIGILVFLACLCRLAMVLKWLTLSGSIAAFFMALIFLYGGISLFYIPLVLFAGGTLLSKLNNDGNEKEGRNAIQVLANGGIGVACLLYYYCFGNYQFISGFILSFSISVCDTFSSEIGKYFNGRTIDILSLKPVKKGLSGGVSLKGTLGGALGVALCSLMSIYTYGESLNNAILLGCFGMAGMFMDSVLGSKFQAKYMNENGEITELKTGDNKLYKGYARCTNDVVNILSNAIVTAVFIILGSSGLF